MRIEGQIELGSVVRNAMISALIAAGLVSLPATVRAQAVVMAGSYQNFDVLNNTGGPTYGFEMEVYGVSASQLTRIFPSNFNAGVIRYGFGTATDFPGGVYVRWIAPYDPATGTFTTSTPVPPSLTTVPAIPAGRSACATLIRQRAASTSASAPRTTSIQRTSSITGSSPIPPTQAT